MHTLKEHMKNIFILNPLKVERTSIETHYVHVLQIAGEFWILILYNLRQTCCFIDFNFTFISSKKWKFSHSYYVFLFAFIIISGGEKNNNGLMHIQGGIKQQLLKPISSGDRVLGALATLVPHSVKPLERNTEAIFKKRQR